MSPLFQAGLSIEKNGLDHCVGPAILDRAAQPVSFDRTPIICKSFVGCGGCKAWRGEEEEVPALYAATL